MSWSSSATPLTDTLLELGQQKELTTRHRKSVAFMGAALARIEEGEDCAVILAALTNTLPTWRDEAAKAIALVGMTND